ncbi:MULTISPECIES: CbbQ/NirQ/NorQ/GpvN family protein [Shewanella]|jgi:nitric oxide reductase NorQ protein|uniref:CbbQ/NirQ/NorQ/GpvN family protein n=1 Tax=Shewanella psychromarinicola TaxID=2487742 RepID=A0A3N4ECA6_9GAMM|nr:MULTISPECIES: CbbQ/NirQ/NorQ/GpvN family protein [Shewanella]AZG36690.1 CbbQ/NirQ/NorQ/GpvN family protein [Shewanella psychromarinicola]MCL1082300.1 CbbQ/NirQ/NorQ/GpvN family protein [Shewanella psychromarinicola]PKG77914.1 AAA family ATPase [Shewanella sp. Actino-trap-3]RPA34542.1 CbbQ/NirQ/NorQ/GpvN family protein [Shewanella psychromarinicola]
MTLSTTTAIAINEQIFYQQQDNEIQLFEYAFSHQLPLLIKGPTGCGKTRFVAYMAEKLGRPLYTVACHDDLTAADLVGRHLIGPKGTYWQDGPLTRAVREGGICYLDEIVEARKDTTVVLHPLADDRRILPIERTGEELAAAQGFMLVVSYNPGYQNILKGMKASTRQRFVALRLGYPNPQLEIQILMTECQIDQDLAGKLIELAGSLRRLDCDLDEVASTRLLIYAARMISSGMSPLAACRSCLAEPLSDDLSTVEALMDVARLYFDC